MLVCFSLLAVIAIPAASGCDNEQKGTSSSTNGATAGTAKGDEAAVRSDDKADGQPPTMQISVVAGTGADKAGFQYAPPLDPSSALLPEEAIARAWHRGAVFERSVSAVLANVTWGDDSDYLRERLQGRDVWVVTYPACSLSFNGASFSALKPLKPQTRTQASATAEEANVSVTPSKCVVALFSAIIDAKTGEWYTTFSPGSSLG